MAVPAPRAGRLLPIVIAAAILVAILLILFTWRDDSREGGTAEDGLPAAVSPSDGEDAGVPAAGAGPVEQTAGEEAGATGAEVDPQPEQPASN